MSILDKPRNQTVIYGMRHGQTPLDISHRSDGFLDLDLTEEGQREIVETLSNYLKHSGVTCIYCAPLRRTEETARILSSGIVGNPEIEVTEGALPWNLGSLAGDPKQPNKKIVQDLLANPEKPAPDGEAYDDFTDRFDTWQDEMFSEAKSEGPLLEVLSGSDCRRLSERLFNDRSVLDIDEAGLFMMYPDVNGKWTADVICGHRDDDDMESNPEAS